MGGEYYERPMEQASSSQSYSASSEKALSQVGLHKSNDPKRWAEEKLVSTHRHPIVFALDVSGSMGDWPKIIYDKLPMFYGQIMMQNYLEDPSVSFCAIDDSYDDAPLQVTEFGQGVQIDQLISKIYLESGGSGTEGRHELYEFSAYFYLRHVELKNAELPFFFVTGDEDFYATLKSETIKKLIGKMPQEKELKASNIWKNLCKHYNVFHLHKPYSDSGLESNELNLWEEALGKKRILRMKTPKACIDVILGVIAIISGARTLPGYIKDMKDRGQSKDRIEEVVHALKVLDKDFLENEIIRHKVDKKKGGAAEEEEKKE